MYVNAILGSDVVTVDLCLIAFVICLWILHVYFVNCELLAITVWFSGIPTSFRKSSRCRRRPGMWALRKPSPRWAAGARAAPAAGLLPGARRRAAKQIRAAKANSRAAKQIRAPLNKHASPSLSIVAWFNISFLACGISNIIFLYIKKK